MYRDHGASPVDWRSTALVSRSAARALGDLELGVVTRHSPHEDAAQYRTEDT